MAAPRDNFKAGHLPNYLLELDTWPDFPNIKQRADRGCAFCSLILKTLQSFGGDPAIFAGGFNSVWIRFRWREDHLAGIAVALNHSLEIPMVSDDYSKEFYIESLDSMTSPFTYSHE